MIVLLAAFPFGVPAFLVRRFRRLYPDRRPEVSAQCPNAALSPGHHRTSALRDELADAFSRTEHLRLNTSAKILNNVSSKSLSDDDRQIASKNLHINQGKAPRGNMWRRWGASAGGGSHMCLG